MHLLAGIDDITDTIITADALHAQDRHARYLRDRGAHHILTAKDNRPKLLTQLKSQTRKQICVGLTCTETTNGREVVRTVKCVGIDTGTVLAHAAQVAKITRHMRNLDSTKWNTETVYVITSLPAERASTALAQHLRAWALEHRGAS